MNIHLIGNQVTIIGETILHSSSPCLKTNPWSYIKPHGIHSTLILETRQGDQLSKYISLSNLYYYTPNLERWEFYNDC